MMHIPAHKNVAHPPGQYSDFPGDAPKWLYLKTGPFVFVDTNRVDPDYLIPADGYADGGEPYTDEELEFFNSEVREAAT